MSTAEIIAQLPQLSPEERAQVQAKLDELAADEWIDGGGWTLGGHLDFCPRTKVKVTP